MDSDRNLLFGVLALQSDLIDASPLSEVLHGLASAQGRAAGGYLDRARLDYDG
jgi:hypothetical protein